MINQSESGFLKFWSLWTGITNKTEFFSFKTLTQLLHKSAFFLTGSHSRQGLNVILHFLQRSIPKLWFIQELSEWSMYCSYSSWILSSSRQLVSESNLGVNIQKNVRVYWNPSSVDIVIFFCYQNCSDLLLEKIVLVTEKKLLKFEAESWEFSKFLRSLEQFIQTVKSQNNFW